MRVIGWNTTHEIGAATIGSPGAGTGSYSLSYIVPVSFNENSITVRFNVSSSNHYRANFAEITINVYSNIQILDLGIYFPNNDTLVSLSNDTSYIVYGINNRDFYINGTLRDNFGRILDSKELRDTWNSIPIRRAGTPSAIFNNLYQFPGWNNGSWNWEIAHFLDEGALAPRIYTISLEWEVYDTTDPTIIIESPSNLETVALANITSTLITVTVTDPDDTDGPGYVSVGLNSSTVTITINGTSYSMINTVGDTYIHNWDTSSVLDGFYIIEITAYDIANNQGSTGLINVVIDVVDPSATINIPTTIGSDSEEYAIMDNFGNILITGDLDDSASITPRNSAIDPTSILLIIQPAGGPPVLTLSSVDLVVTTSFYSYNWSIFDLVTYTRDISYSSIKDWEIIVYITDIAGNTNQTTLSLLLENENDPINLPLVSFTEQPPTRINQDTFEVSINHTDLQSGIKMELLYFTMYDEVTNTEVAGMIYRFNDPEVSSSDNITTTLQLTKSDFENGDYYIVASVFDNVGNLRNRSSTIFQIVQFTSTTTTTTTTTSTTPGQPPSLAIDLVQFIFIDIIALLSGVGIAVLYERIKARRKV